MYMLLLVVLGAIILFTTFMVKPKRRIHRRLVSLGLLLIVVGGSGIYESYQNPSANQGDNPRQAEKTTTSANTDLANLNYLGRLCKVPMDHLIPAEVGKMCCWLAQGQWNSLK